MFVHLAARETKDHDPQPPLFSASLIGKIIVIDVFPGKRQEAFYFVVNHLAQRPTRGLRHH